MPLFPPQSYRKTEFTHRQGLAADRPAAADVLVGTLYFSTDTVTLERSDGATWSTYSGGGGLTVTDFTKDLGASDRSGTFDITGLAGLTPDKNVLIMQTMQQISSKGNARDEPEMDLIRLTGYVLDAATIRASWLCESVVVGTYAFAYSVSG